MKVRHTPAASDRTEAFHGNDSALLGIVLSVISFWLFAQTTLNIGPAIGQDIGAPPPLMNAAISLTALCAGMFIVAAGGLADRFGRVRFAMAGNVLNIVGSLMVGIAFPGPVGIAMLLAGRSIQGLSSACVMPATLALIKTYWQGENRQRAVSIFSMGTWGGSGLASLFGGFMAASPLGWRSIFLVSAGVSIAAMLLLRQVPEDAPERSVRTAIDYPGIASLAVFVLGLLLVVTQGPALGWRSWPTLLLLGASVISLAVFIRVERATPRPLVDFSVFRNRVFAGATLSNLLINATAGLIPVSMWVIQDSAGWTTAQAGYLTIGYAVFILAFIRLGERLLQRFGARQPMVWGTLIVIASIALLMLTPLPTRTYVVLTAISYCLYGLGLAFYATPSTDTALAALPTEKAGAGSGLYKMASSLGAAFGAAIPASIYVAVSHNGVSFLSTMVPFPVPDDNLAVREAGMLGLGATLLMALVALSFVYLVPRSAGTALPD
ncbi:MFS transporter [Corynebacterium liangguodongii]|uniref:MFS transporter n=1 Tax=Corynebacterium liangguodongii TaxID=2079535 RepID=A0A2S0WC90_9CORY|nr:MFS transporter [Corynebacterium liangguodongii]AWB83385.1 MFS transporter [Corynebacterium liangguodongii]PWC00525.1 MFS transporter [Corynebacterium liangguodongii]